MTSSGEWFRSWFGDTYLALYPHRDEEEAEMAVRLLHPLLGERRNACILDLACGAGRHLRAMARADLSPVGFDLSPTLLAEARRSAPRPLRLVRGDMRRLPFRRGAFDIVTNFFTSFGYFAAPEEDRQVAGEMARVLRDGGAFLLDYLNAARVRASLVPEDEDHRGDHTILQRRWVEGTLVVKRIEVHRPGAEVEVHHERVRLYEPRDLEGILAEEGLEVAQRFGDYDGSPFGPDSPRLILLGRRT
ncbi:MAG: class I SAM-dependent methyltransferase [Gemmatimonadota bacterium]